MSAGTIISHEVYLGEFDIGYENVELFANDSAGGEFVTNPSPQIRIGIAPPDWSFVYQTVLHEALEYAAFRTQSRFTPDCDLSGDCGSFMFLMDHARFSNICGRATKFMIGAVPAIRKIWETFHCPKTRGKLQSSQRK